jgi:hypothetical protein
MVAECKMSQVYEGQEDDEEHDTIADENLHRGTQGRHRFGHGLGDVTVSEELHKRMKTNETNPLALLIVLKRKLADCTVLSSQYWEHNSSRQTHLSRREVLNPPLWSIAFMHAGKDNSDLCMGPTGNRRQ